MSGYDTLCTSIEEMGRRKSMPWRKASRNASDQKADALDQLQEAITRFQSAGPGAQALQRTAGHVMQLEPASRMIGEWLGSRAALKQLEAGARPDLVDSAGRRWVWWKGDLYRHTVAKACAESCQGGADHGTFAWPRSLLREPVAVAAEASFEA